MALQFQAELIGRTLLLACAAGVVATALGFWPAWVWVRKAHRSGLWVLLPMLVPPVVVQYAWAQVFRQADLLASPGSWWDHAQGVWVLGAWLWPVSALIMGQAMSSLGDEVLDQCRLEAKPLRGIIANLKWSIAGAAILTGALATAEMSIFERSGIRVISTEVRMVFETGQGLAADATIGQRAWAAVQTGLPMLAIPLAILVWMRGRWGAALAGSATGARAVASDGRGLTRWAAVAVAVGVVVVPWVSLLTSWVSPPAAIAGFKALLPGVLGTLLLGSILAAGLVAMGTIALWLRLRALAPISLIVFLGGSQMVAILILVTVPELDAWAWLVLHWLRLAWVMVLVAEPSWHGEPGELRRMAASDGMGRGPGILRVAWPIAGARIVLASLVCAAMAVGDSASVAIIAPREVPLVMSQMLQWLHLLRYDDMIAACVLLTLTALALVAVGLLGTRLIRGRRAAILLMLAALAAGGCDRGDAATRQVGGTGASKGQFVYPRAIAADRDNGWFYVCDRLARVQRFSASGEVLSLWIVPDTQQGKPVGISVGPDHNLYVADTHGHRVLVYSPEGKLLRSFGSLGRGPGQFELTTDVAFDAQGLLYVGEYGGNDRIQVFSPTGQWIRSFGSPGHERGEFARPQSLLVRGGELFVADSSNHRISVFTLEGKWLRDLGGVGDAPGQLRFPYGLDLDREGNLVVCEWGNHRVQWLDANTGKSLGMWGKSGRDAASVSFPWGVAVGKDDTWVLDSGNNRVQVLHR